MNRSYSKLRHIQEANIRLEKRILNEQIDSVDSIVNKNVKDFVDNTMNAFFDMVNKIESDLVSANIPHNIQTNMVELESNFIKEMTGLSEHIKHAIHTDEKLEHELAHKSMSNNSGNQSGGHH